MPAFIAEPAALLIRPSNLAALVLLVALLVLLAGRRRLGTGLVAAGLGLVVVFGFLPVGEALLRPLEQRFPFTGHPYDGTGGTAPAGIIVLGGFIDREATAAHRTPVLNDSGDRLLQAALLAKRFEDAKVIITDGPAAARNGMRLGAPLAGRILAGLGIAEDRLVLEAEAMSTFENAVFTRRLVDPAPGATFILVTSAFHMPRAMGTFRAAGWTGLHPWPVDYKTAGARPGALNASAAKGLTLSNIAVREYAALLAYHLSGRTDALLPAPAGP